MREMKDLQVDEKQFGRIEAIISSMTKQERQDPSIIDGSRRRRIAAGSGTSPADVNRLLKQHGEAKKLVRRVAGMEKGGRGLPGLLRP